MLDFHKKNTNIANIYVSIFVHFQQFWFLMYRWNKYPTLYVSFSAILFNNIMMKIVKIYVSINGYLFEGININ